MARGEGGFGKAVSAVFPPPPAFTVVTRVVEISTLVVTAIWVFGYLGGVGLKPVVTGQNSNDPSVIFNWHPLFMAMAFPILMAEAVLAYRVPLAASSDK